MRTQFTPLGLLCLLVGLLIFGQPANARGEQNQDPVDLTLKTAMAMAIRNNLDLRVDALDSSIAEASLQSNRGIYDPFLSLSVSHGQTFYTGETYGTKDTTSSLALTQYLSSGGSITASTHTGYTKPVSDFPDENWTDWYTSVGITFSQPLLRNFGKESTERGISLAENAYKVSLERFRDSVIATVYDVIKSYNRLYALRQVLEARQNALASAQHLLAELKKDKNNAASEISLANTEYTISQRLKDLVNAESDVRDQEAKVLFLIGVKKRVELNPVDPPSRTEPLETEKESLALAMENGPRLKPLRLDLRSSELQTRVAKRALLPNLSFNASVGFRGIEDTFQDSAQQIGDGKGQWWAAGLQFSVPLGNSVAESEYRRNQLRTDQLKNRIAAAEWKLRDDIEEDLRSLISARLQIQVADKAVKLSQQRYEQYRKSVARKQSTVLDLLNVENDLVNARNSQTEALEKFSNAVALLWKDSGVLLERKEIKVNLDRPEELTVGVQGLPEPDSPSPEMKVASQSVPAAASPPLPSKIIKLPVADNADKVPQVAGKRAVKKSTAVKRAMYTLSIGEYASSELEKVRSQLKTEGLVISTVPGGKRPRQVVRLAAGDYPDQKTVQARLRQLQKDTAGGFFLKHGPNAYRLYAGSYFSQVSAEKERRRLAGLGYDLKLETTEVLLPTTQLLLGRFNSREEARQEEQKLKALGFDAVIKELS